jgi:predicted DNA-binding antitoxin AbrB/MazE fold protein
MAIDVNRTIDAVYEDGVFRPKESVSLPFGFEVKVLLPEYRDPDEILRERYPLSYGSISEEDAREMERVIEESCERIEPDGGHSASA